MGSNSSLISNTAHASKGGPARVGPMRADAIVVGGGIMGCMTALRLADEGLHVTVLEKSVPGAEASSAAAGILGPTMESFQRPEALRLGIQSRELHAALSEELRDACGLDVGFRRSGLLRLALSERDANDLEDHVRALQRLEISHRRLDANQTREIEPSCNPAVLAAVDMPDEAQVDPRQLLKAVALTCEARGVRFRSGTTVREVRIAKDKVQGVQVDDESLDCACVVVAAGSWTSLVPGAGTNARTIFPVRGQMVATETRPPLFRRVVFGAGGYVVTRPNGAVLCGSTEERVGFVRGVTFEGLSEILRIATAIAPVLADAVVTDQWSSFRPGTPDGLPLVGSAGSDGLFLASGHYRNGILLAPLTAQLIADAVMHRDTHPAAPLLSPTRFAEAR